MKILMNDAQLSGGLLQQALQNIRDGVYIVDPERKILFWNSGAERITGYTAAEITGSFCFDHILQHIDDTGQLLCHTSCSLAKTLDDGEVREADIYLHHKEGQRVPVHIHVAPIRNAIGRVTGAVETFSENRVQREIRERMAGLEKMALYDALTGIANRRYLESRFEIRLAELNRYGWPFGLAILDLDDFKKINDTRGHDCGDRILKIVSATLLNNMRPFDDVGRWGGEEFLVLASNIGGKELWTLIDRLRILAGASSPRLDGCPLSATVSAGITLAQPGESRESVLKRADDALYESKRSGKNRVTLL